MIVRPACAGARGVVAIDAGGTRIADVSPTCAEARESRAVARAAAVAAGASRARRSADRACETERDRADPVAGAAPPMIALNG